MKSAFIVIALVSMMSNAYATHAYRSEECTSSTHQFTYDGNYPIGGYYSISKLGDDHFENRIKLVPLDLGDVYDEEEIKSMANFKTSDVKQIGEAVETSADCFDTTVTEYTQTLTFSNLKASESANLGIKNDQKIEFVCTEQLDYPNGCK